MKKRFFSTLLLMLMISLVFSTQGFAQASSSTTTEETQMNETNAIGSMLPDEALEYMKTVPNLFIVDTATAREYEQNHFDGAVNIHYTEMAERYDEIPENRPVLLHCGGGIVSVEAYEILQEKRPDIPQLSYIAGAPPITSYNAWLAEQ